ncbi:DNA repair protein RadA [Oligella ureolytica]
MPNVQKIHSNYFYLSAMAHNLQAVQQQLEKQVGASAFFQQSKTIAIGQDGYCWLCVMATQEGTRPLLVEIQALADAAHVPNPRRLSIGLEGSRLAMLLAVLHRHGGIPTFDHDVFINAVGGVRITETASH